MTVNYQYETHRSTPTTAYTKGRQSRVRRIVVHHYGDDSATYESSVAWLTRPAATTSAHYVVDAGRVACIVDPDDTAWHAGDWITNSEAVGIENHPIWTKAREDTLIQLCADLEEVYGSLLYSIHQDHSSTACPGRWKARMPYIIAGVNKELARRRAPQGYVHVPGVKAFHVVKPGDTVGGLVRYYRSRQDLIVKWNGLASADRIEVGQKLRVR